YPPEEDEERGGGPDAPTDPAERRAGPRRGRDGDGVEYDEGEGGGETAEHEVSRPDRLVPRPRRRGLEGRQGGGGGVGEGVIRGRRGRAQDDRRGDRDRPRGDLSGDRQGQRDGCWQGEEGLLAGRAAQGLAGHLVGHTQGAAAVRAADGRGHR